MGLAHAWFIADAGFFGGRALFVVYGSGNCAACDPVCADECEEAEAGKRYAAAGRDERWRGGDDADQINVFEEFPLAGNCVAGWYCMRLRVLLR